MTDFLNLEVILTQLTDAKVMSEVFICWSCAPCVWSDPLNLSFTSQFPATFVEVIGFCFSKCLCPGPLYGWSLLGHSLTPRAAHSLPRPTTVGLGASHFLDCTHASNHLRDENKGKVPIYFAHSFLLSYCSPFGGRVYSLEEKRLSDVLCGQAPRRISFQLSTWEGGLDNFTISHCVPLIYQY